MKTLTVLWLLTMSAYANLGLNPIKPTSIFKNETKIFEIDDLLNKEEINQLKGKINISDKKDEKLKFEIINMEIYHKKYLSIISFLKHADYFRLLDTVA